MLDYAIKYKEEIEKKSLDIWGNPKYKFYNNKDFESPFIVSDNTYNSIEFVSINKTTNEIIGMITFEVDRSSRIATSLGIINFTDLDQVIFGKNIFDAIKKVLFEFNFNKICFEVIIGNPIESTYDKLIEKFNGNIIGVRRKHVRLIDGEMYDVKLYEILKEDINTTYMH